MSVFGKKESRSNFAAGRQDRSPSPAMVYFVFCSATLFSLVYVWSIYRAAHQGHLTFVAIGLLAFKTLVEVGSSYYGFAFLFIALAYIFRREGESAVKLVDNFENPRIAIVQFRNVAVVDPNTCSVNRLLSRSIDAFNVFLTAYSRFGWQPFVGHNALLKTAAVMQAGGFTPGFFSDDLDLTVRLNLGGYRVAYAPDIQFGEKHPGNHSSYRRRSYKWA